MKAIYKRELQAYFKTPVGYIFIGMFLLVSAFFFIISTLLSGYPTIDAVLYNLLSVFMFVIPILTMRLLSEERNKKTDQVLLTSPVSVPSIVLGKFFAACTIYLITLVFTLLYLTVVAAHGEPMYAQTFCSYIGFILLGVTFISIGLFISALTENQIVAAVITFVVLILLNLMESFQGLVANPAFSKIISALAVTSRFNGFNMGILSLESVVYYVSVSALFVYLTCFVTESRRLK